LHGRRKVSVKSAPFSALRRSRSPGPARPALAIRGEADLAPQAAEIGRLEARAEGRERLAIRPAPPEYGSPQFTAAPAEVKNYGRSPQAIENAIYWRAYGGGRNYQLWNSELSRRALEHGYAQDSRRIAAS
jgi:hypothetical protein